MQYSFSQFGEDLAIRQFAIRFGLEKGIYVDVGAYHPIVVSNTLLDGGGEHAGRAGLAEDPLGSDGSCTVIGRFDRNLLVPL